MLTFDNKHLTQRSLQLRLMGMSSVFAGNKTILDIQTFIMLMMVLDKKSGDHQIRRDLLSRNHERLFEMLCQSIQV